MPAKYRNEALFFFLTNVNISHVLKLNIQYRLCCAELVLAISCQNIHVQHVTTMRSPKMK